MKIIGEKINGTRQQVAQAIAERDGHFIQELAQKQAEAGAAWLDINAGTRRSEEVKDLIWLAETVQRVVDVPLCLDSDNPDALSATLQVIDHTPMINSINGESQRLEGILPLVAEYGCPTIALAMDEAGIQERCDGRMEVVGKIMESVRKYGVMDGNVFIDPLVMPLATNAESASITIDTMKAIKDEFPDVSLIMGLSNVSFGLPSRSIINRVFLVLAMAAGLDCVILDPLDPELRKTMIVAELVLGRDRHCQNYTRAYRNGFFNGVKNPGIQQ